MPPKKPLPPRVSEKHGAWHLTYDLPERSAITGKPKQRSMIICRVSEGEAKLYERLAEIKGITIKPGGNFAARLKEFQAEYLPTLAHASRKEYARIYALAADDFQDFDTEQVKAKHIKDFVRLKFSTPRMQRDGKSRLSTFMRWCVVCDYAATNPCEFIEIKQMAPKRFDWTPAKWHAIRNALVIDKNGQAVPSGAMMQCYIDLCFLLYQRNTDVRLLLIPQVDYAAGLIRFVPAKTEHSTGANVSVPITADIAAVLRRATAIRAAWDADGRKIWKYAICKRDGTSYTASGLRDAWDAACTRAQIKGLTSKSIRAYAATEADRQGYTKGQIQKGLAHRLITTTEGYVARHEEVISAITLALPAVSK